MTVPEVIETLSSCPRALDWKKQGIATHCVIPGDGFPKTMGLGRAGTQDGCKGSGCLW